MKRERPQGLGSVAKKEKADEERINCSTDEGVKVIETSETSSSNGKILYELPEDATALDQLRAIFESATMFLDDASKSKPIFNGVIHECLRLEAILENEEGPEEQEGDEKDLDSFLQVKKDSEKIFNAEFYYMFGESLRCLAEFEMNEDVEESSLDQIKGLLSASIDRFQLSKEKLKTEESFSADLHTGLIYSMASLYMLIDGNDTLMTDMTVLIGEGSKDTAISAMFDSIEFFCAFIETAYENDYEIEGLETFGDLLEKNISSIDGFCSDARKLKLIKVDVPLRLAVIRSEEIEGEKSELLLAELEEILKTEEELGIRYEALQLKASIKEILGLEEEANLIYEEADSLQIN